MQRVSVVGNSGAGKTRIAAELAARLVVPHLELDAVFHQPNWAPLSAEEFRRAAASAIAADSWVIDGNYSAVRDLVWQRSDTVVWLDLSRTIVMRQLLARTLRRMATRTELWNGNRESLRNLLDKDESIIAWAWNNQAKYREQYAGAAADPAFRHLSFVRLTSRAEIRRFLDGL
ncbi:MAG: adenylate kinase [Jiangellaceae bacterium]|nr:adenylate kinase [Jiangellaceae bacterium]